MTDSGQSLGDIAIVGMAAHLPGAPDVRAYWKNLRAGVESVTQLTDEELAAAGVPADERANPRYVKSAVLLDGVDRFDAEFFGFGPKEAAILDPQHRHFLECAWEALEDAGHVPERFDGTIALFAGCGMGSYFIFNLLTNPALVKSVGMFLLRHTGNDKDFLATRVAYLFDLKGPVVSVQTACSTSLVAVHMAVQSLLSGECDLALAGGVTIEVPHGRGYVFEDGEILSPDGHCRAFDAESKGTVFGSGAGIVVLRRLEDALRDGDCIRAVIKGSAINNDGSGKVGYLAPSVDGQAAAIAEAISVAGVPADSIGYVECHGTGTAMGDPIEVAALTQAFRETTKKSGFCGIGSVKTNIGHLDTAAGVASLIKATLALEHGALPPSLNWSAPNPAIDFATTPFQVVNALREWPRRAGAPRRAGVNSLGVGGTNAHAIIEEAPLPARSTASKRGVQLLVLSARNAAALDQGAKRLAERLREEPALELADVAWTLVHGRRAFSERRVFACRSREEALGLLESNDPKRVFGESKLGERVDVAFLLPGGGTQHARMGRELARSEPVFREALERGMAALKSRHGLDLAPLLAADGAALPAAEKELERPSVQLPAIFLVECALAKLWEHWGLRPAALLGHSMGENTAAHLAGVFSFEDALGLVTLRGQLFERAPQGAMLSVALGERELRPLLAPDVDLAVVNADGACVVSGPPAAVEAFAKTLAEREIDAQRVPITTAAHSRLVEPILGEFRAYLERIRLSPPKVPIVSNRTGTWLTDAQATSPAYWVEHLRHTVHFAEGARTLLAERARVLLEVGPGRTLASLARANAGAKARCIVSSLPHPDDPAGDVVHFTTVLGRLWGAGVRVELGRLWEGEQRRRVALPSYAFQRQRYWIEPGKPTAVAAESKAAGPARLAAFDDWFHAPAWIEAPVVEAARMERTSWLVFLDRAGVGARLADRLRAAGDSVVVVREGDGFARVHDDEFRLAPEHGRGGYDALVRELVASGQVPSRIVHLWTWTPDERFRPGSSFFHQMQECGYYSLLFLAQALAAEGAPTPIHIDVLTNGLAAVEGEAPPHPEKATLLGPVRVIPREHAGVTCRLVDVPLPRPRKLTLSTTPLTPAARDAACATLERELRGAPANGFVAWRDGVRREETTKRIALAPRNGGAPALREKGVYLITGGLGGLGLVFAEHLARTAHARLVLVARTELPERALWDAWIQAHSDDNVLRRRMLAIRKLEELGADVLVARADVTDLEEMRSVVDAARARFGALHGVLHAAGIVNDQLIATHGQSDSEDVFAPKLHGTHVLETLFAGAELDFLLLFSSTSVVTAPPGQVDYVAANAFLNAFAAARSAREKGRTIALGWGVWAQVGMAAESIAARARPPEQERALEPSRAHPLLEARADRASGGSHFLARWSTARHWVLDEHRTRDGQALLPGTGYLELAAAALAARGERGPFELDELFFFRPLAVDDGKERAVRVRLVPNDEGYDFAVQSEARIADGRAGWVTHAQAIVRIQGPVATATPSARMDRAAIAARCDAGGLVADERGIRTAQEAELRFGPRWRVLREARFGRDEGLARLELQPEFAAEVERFRLHPALLDLATTFALPILSAGAEQSGLWVPLSYGRVRVHAPLTARIWSHARVKRDPSAGADFARFSLELADDSGRVLVEIDDFAMKRVDDPGRFALGRAPSAAEVELVADAERPLSPAELALRRTIELGITPLEGTQAFDRVLANATGGSVIVSSLDLDELARASAALAARDAAASADGPRFERPALASEYIAPKDEIERTLAGFWEELLGVGNVGVQDSFFDLGGHSLIAVRLFARIKKAWHVEYPISVLFEAPTIAACAEMLRAHVAARAGQDGGAPAAAPKARYQHLVAMHAGENSSRRPFFLVAGMFGNVLNLRHLAHLVGADRPTYGLQARGLYGDLPPHETFEEMADAYLAELRTVQERGPYLLGGFSGGGITAYEMARRLIARGEKVEALVLLDTPLPRSPLLSSTDKLLIHLQKLQRSGPAYVTHWAREKLLWKLASRKKHDEDAAAVGPAQYHSPTIEAAFRRALDRYELVPLPIRVHLFRPRLDRSHALPGGRVTNTYREFVFHDNGWTPFVSEVDVHEVPGNHDGMVLEPNVRVLANRLRRVLDQAEARRTPAPAST